MLYYRFKFRCPKCLTENEAGLIAESEPPPDTILQPRCSNHGGPIPVAFRNFKPCEPFPPTRWHLRFPPRPEEEEPPRRWWQFWKR